MVGGPFNSGVLAPARAGPTTTPTAPPEVLARVERLAAVCARFDVPLAAAALQFAAAPSGGGQRDPGRRRPPSEVAANVGLMDVAIPPRSGRR